MSLSGCFLSDVLDVRSIERVALRSGAYEVPYCTGSQRTVRHIVTQISPTTSETISISKLYFATCNGRMRSSSFGRSQEYTLKQPKPPLTAWQAFLVAERTPEGTRRRGAGDLLVKGLVPMTLKREARDSQLRGVCRAPEVPRSRAHLRRPINCTHRFSIKLATMKIRA
jgi:hypothetical protein